MLYHKCVHIPINDHTPIWFCALFHWSLYFLIWLFLINQSIHHSSFHVSSSPFLLHSVSPHFSLSMYVQETVYPWVCPYVYVFVCERKVCTSMNLYVYMYTCTCRCSLLCRYGDAEGENSSFYPIPQRKGAHWTWSWDGVQQAHVTRWCLVPTVLGLCVHGHPWLLYGSWYSNSGSHAWLDSGFIH